MSLPDIFDVHNTKPLHPFYNKHVYFSGEFLHTEEELQKKLEEFGALNVNEIEYADVIVVGYNQPVSDVAKREKRRLWDGYLIPTITEEQLFSICPLCWEYFEKLLEPKKRTELNITYDHFVNPIYTPIAHFTDDEDAPTLEDKNVFMLDEYDKDDLRDDPVRRFLAEKLGAIVSAHYDPKKTDYCLLRESTLEKLKEGQKDTFIKMIENGYNNSYCTEFRQKFILESEVIDLMRRRNKDKQNGRELDNGSCQLEP